jgi:hypothetical protein
MVRRVERALAEWRAVLRRLEGLTPHSAEWDRASHDADLAQRQYEAAVEGHGIGPGTAAVEDLGDHHVDRTV